MEILFSHPTGFIKTTEKVTFLMGCFNGFSFEMRYTEFYLLHKKLNKFSIPAMLYDLSDKPDCNKIQLQQGKCKINCSLYHLIALKELFNGAMFFIRLQDILYNNSIKLSEKCEQSLHQKSYLVSN